MMRLCKDKTRVNNIVVQVGYKQQCKYCSCPEQSVS